MKTVFMTWVPSSSRTKLLSEALGAEAWYVRYLSRRTFISTVLRYGVAAIDTVFTLYRRKPHVVITMNQPVFLPMIIFCYAKLAASYYILDSHSGLLNKTIWRVFTPLMKKIYRDSLLNIAHNEHDAARYRSWGARTEVLGTELYPYETYEKTQLKTNNNIVVIGSFASDEPTEAVVETATRLQGFHFYFTGSRARAQKRIDIGALPGNVTLTGFLPHEQFVGLVKAADVALVLVKTENTMQMGAWEAMSCDTPLILSKSRLLRTTFPKGAVFVSNTPEGIANGIIEFFANKDRLTKDISSLKQEKRRIWNSEIDKVKARLDPIQ